MNREIDGKKDIQRLFYGETNEGGVWNTNEPGESSKESSKLYKRS